MVNPEVANTRNQAEYGLDGVHRLAGFNQVVFTSRRVHRHVDNLGYLHEDVCAKLLELRECHFHHSENYLTNSRWHDVYFLPHPVAGFPDERLYIKLRVSNDCVSIELCSFHPEGWT